MRILLVKTSSLGDVIHNLPVVSDIARMLPGATIDWCVEDSFARLPALHPAVGSVIPVAVRRWRKHAFSPSTWRELRQFRGELRAAHYDAIIDTQGLVKSALLARWAHGKRIGYDRDSIREPLAASFYNERIAVPRDLHAVDRNRWLAAIALDYPLDNLPLDYGLAPPPFAADWLPEAPYAVCLTATSRDDKLWPEDDWHRLLAHINRIGMKAVLPTGNADERARAERIAATVRNAVVAPRLGLREVAGVIADAHLAVGVDTGLTHLAAALGIPTIALYTASDPGLTGVLGSNLHINLGGRERCPPASEVRAAVDQALA